MKKTIIALILVIPLIFMFTVFSAGSVAGIGVDIPAGSIEILNKPDDGVLAIDLAGYEDDFEVDAAVYPVRAKNRGYSVKVEAADSESPLAGITVGEDRKLRATGVGKARITAVSHDGGFSDSFVAIVYSSEALDFGLSLFEATDAERENDLLEAGTNTDYSASVRTGKYNFSADFLPADTNAEISVESSDPDLVSIDPLARTIAFLFGGSADLTFSAQGAKGTLKRTVRFDVTRVATSSGITVNGENNLELLLHEGSDSLSCFVELDASLRGEPALSGANIGYLKSWKFTAMPERRSAGMRYQLDAVFAESRPSSLAFDISVSGSGAEAYRLTLNFGEFAFNVRSSGKMQPSSAPGAVNTLATGNVTLFAVAALETTGIEYRWTLSGGNGTVTATTSDGDGRSCRIEAIAERQAFSIAVTAWKNGYPVDKGTKSFNFETVRSLTALQFTDRTDLGLGKTLAIGEKQLESGVEIDANYAFSLKAYRNSASETFRPEDVRFVSSDDSVAKIVETNGRAVLKIFRSGTVTLRAEWIHNEALGANVTASITVQAVKGGVQVDTSAEFITAAKAGRRIVLTKDVVLGTDASGKALPIETLKGMVSETKTTYNDQYCVNAGLSSNVKFLVELKNDLHGNGHTVNAEPFTTAKDSTGKPQIFTGPLPFAAIATAKVSAQDNVVFLMRTDGVTVHNAELAGCGDGMLEDDDGGYDLTKLNLTGTTVDVNASVSLLNCRIKNGRTAIRVYGGNRSGNAYFVSRAVEVDARSERITVRIEGCIVTQAREFLIKLGANRALRGNENDLMPVFRDASGKSYDSQGEGRASNAYLDDEYFQSNYVLTDLTLKNSVLATSGLFSIGVESNFSGGMLNDPDPESMTSGWYGIGGTSFASVLRLSGDVRIYDWKNLDNVDSSTLIETGSGASSFLTLDIKAMLNRVYETDPKYGELFTGRDGAFFVHGGIAFYGGGRNYSQLSREDFDASLDDLHEYYVNIAVLFDETDPNSDLSMQGQLLPKAAGEEDFRFYLYNNGSANSLAGQERDFASGSAYGGVLPVLPWQRN